MEYIEAEMKGKNIYELLPQDKFDNKNIEKLKMLEDKEIKLLIPELLEWLQDYNWPVADDVLQVLLQRENLVVPCVKEILEGSVDVSWFIWLMDLLIPTFTKEHKEEFREILYKIKNMEVVDEDTEALAEEAEKCWEKCFNQNVTGSKV